MMSDMGKILIGMGILFMAAGVFLLAGGKFPFLGRLPGDIHFSSGNVNVYFPWVTCLLVSVIGSILLNIFFRR